MSYLVLSPCKWGKLRNMDIIFKNLNPMILKNIILTKAILLLLFIEKIGTDLEE